MERLAASHKAELATEIIEQYQPALKELAMATDYNSQSFFVRHAYFTGADDPYEKLRRAFKAEINEAAWASLYSAVSRPFAPPVTGKIAVKVINHFGDEVLKVYEVPVAK